MVFSARLIPISVTLAAVMLGAGAIGWSGN
jgi:hypothetical protein